MGVLRALSEVFYAPLTGGQYYNRPITVLDTVGSPHTQSYKLYVPTGYDHTQGYRAMVGLAGSGEYGTNNTSQLNAGLGKYVNANLSTFPYLAVLPQFPLPADFPGTILEKENMQHRMVYAALADAVSFANVDQTKVGLTGFSSGGFRIWAIAQRNPETWCSLSSVEGGIVTPEFLNDPLAPDDHGVSSGAEIVLATLPIRQYQHTDDGTVPPATYGYPVRGIFGGPTSGTSYTAPATYGHYINPSGFYQFQEAATGGHSDDWVYQDQASADGYWAWIAAQSR